MVAIAERAPQEQDFSFEAFYERYGAVVGIDRDVLNEMWQASQQLMPPQDSKYGYHNVLHAQMATWDAMAISDRRESETPGLQINRRVLTLAALFHDAFYDIPIEEHGLGSKEAFSSYIMRYTAPDYGFDEAETDFAEEIIMATKLGTEPRAVEEEIMIEADIANVAQDYETRFMQSFFKLAGEAVYEKSKQNLPLNVQEYYAGSIKALCTYLSFLDKNSAFVKAAAANIRRLASELAAQDHTSMAKYVLSLGSGTVNKVLGIRLPLGKD